MKVVVGLGNPGAKYANTKHNVGFVAIDSLAEKWTNNVTSTFSKFHAHITEVRVHGEKVLLVKPLTYMNLSGEAIRPILDYYKVEIEDVVVIYDDLDMMLGKLRFREKGSAGGHNGIKSIIQHLGTEIFKRVKIGIGRPSYQPVVDYVLSSFTKEEAEMVQETVGRIDLAIEDWVKGETFIRLMNKYQ